MYAHKDNVSQRRFPVDIIKIDCSFVRDIEEDPEDAAIVSALISLGKGLGLTTVAERIETGDPSKLSCRARLQHGPGLLSRPTGGSRRHRRADLASTRFSFGEPLAARG